MHFWAGDNRLLVDGRIFREGGIRGTCPEVIVFVVRLLEDLCAFGWQEFPVECLGRYHLVCGLEDIAYKENYLFIVKINLRFCFISIQQVTFFIKSYFASLLP